MIVASGTELIMSVLRTEGVTGTGHRPPYPSPASPVHRTLGRRNHPRHRTTLRRRYGVTNKRTAAVRGGRLVGYGSQSEEARTIESRPANVPRTLAMNARLTSLMTAPRAGGYF